MEALSETADHENVTILLRDGRTLARTVEHPRGSAALPFSEDELLAKFDSCMDGVLGADAATALKQALVDIASLDDIRALTPYLSLANCSRFSTLLVPRQRPCSGDWSPLSSTALHQRDPDWGTESYAGRIQHALQ